MQEHYIKACATVQVYVPFVPPVKKVRQMHPRIPNPGIPDCFAIPKSRDYDRVIPENFGIQNGQKVNFLR